MRRAEYLAAAYFARKDEHTPITLADCIRRSRRDRLTTILAWCLRHPDASAQCLVKFIHDDIHDGNL